MKIKTFTTAATTLLGATLIGSGQTQNEQRPDSVVGASSTEQTSGAAGASTTTDAAVDAAHGTTGGRSQSTTGATTGGLRESSGARTNQSAGATTGTTGGRSQSTTGAAASQSRSQGASSDAAANMMKWQNAEKSEVALDKIPENARNTLNSVSAGAEVNEQVTKLTKDNEEVYHARLTRSGQEDLHIFVKEDGTVVKTKQKVDVASAPESVRSALREQLGGSDAQPKEFYRVVMDEKTSYVATTGEDANARMIMVDSAGKVVHTGSHSKTDAADRPDTAGSNPGGLQDDRAANRAQQPDAPRPDTQQQPADPDAPSTGTPPADPVESEQ